MLLTQECRWEKSRLHIPFHIFLISRLEKQQHFVTCTLKSFSVVIQYRAFPVSLGFANQPKQKHGLTSHRNIPEEIAHLIYGRNKVCSKRFLPSQ